MAIWLTPGNTDMTLGRMLQAGMATLPFRVGLSGTLRFCRALPATETFHKSVHGPHWYLMTLGVQPEYQGSGLGSSLIKVGTDKADAAGLPCYLETATEQNGAFYTKRGFDVIDQANVLSFSLYGMVRPPR